ncbi:Methyltransferase domain protein [compost metagenome]
MSLLTAFANSKLLRSPLLAASRLMLRPLHSGPKLLRRAAYDAMPVPYLVVGGRELFVVSTADRVIGRELFLSGEFDFRKLQLALEIIDREGASRPVHLIDVGANVGSIVIPALKRGLVQTATAIEPHPDNLRMLRANLSLNQLQEFVRVIAVAVGDGDSSELMLKESETNGGNHCISEKGIPVLSASLDSLDLPLDSALLWMDIEGYEGHALDGAASLLARRVPIVAEFNPGYLAASGGLGAFYRHLRDRRIFNLADSTGKEISLEELAHLYQGTFTDVLAL